MPAPAPFIVGVPRSGTTLLRMQLDAHPQLAIPPETSFGTVAAKATQLDGPQAMLDSLREHVAWRDLCLDDAEVLGLLSRIRPWSVRSGMRAIYALLALREGKARWGDKTPGHLLCMSTLAEVLPEARFIHIIRDGRAVAASVRGLPFAPGDGSIEAIADDWCMQIVEGRRVGATRPNYREVRYEHLVTAPEAALRDLCAYIQLDFHPAMLRAHELAPRRLDQLPERTNTPSHNKAERLARHANLLRPPNASLATRWREVLAPDEVARFEGQAGDLLEELGYAAASDYPEPRRLRTSSGRASACASR